MKRSREFWVELAAEYERGDETVAELARRHGVRATTLSWWRWQLGRDRSRRARRRQRGAAGNDVRLVPVEIAAAEPATSDAAALIEVVLDAGLRVRFVAGADAAYVGALVRELRAC